MRKAMVPTEITKQVQEILDSDMTEQEARERYPGVFNWFNSQIDLVDLIRGYGVDLKPLSPDCPDVLLGNCPECSGMMLVSGAKQ